MTTQDILKQCIVDGLTVKLPDYCEKLEQEIKKEAHKIPAKTFWQKFKFNK